MNTKIEQNRQGFDRKVAQIRGYAELTDEAKRRMLLEAYEEAAARHREIVEERERKAAERAASAGDATDEKLSTLLEWAERSGEPRLAEAVYHVANERGLRGVAGSYLEKRPAERKRWEEYAQARQEAESANPWTGSWLAGTMAR